MAVLLMAAAAAPANGASAVAVYPTPGTSYNLPATQISFRGIAPGQIGSVQVAGSVTGQHTGQIKADPDGQGASFVPDQPFKPGEKVTVTTSLNVVGASGGTFSFKIAETAPPINPGPLPLVAPGKNGVQHFSSRPDLLPATVAVVKDTAPSSQGDIFLAPQYGPEQDGPMILDPHGGLIWFDPIPVAKETLVTDFRVQTYKGQPVLTWWQGFSNRGSGRGVGYIYDRTYRQVAVIRAGNGLSMDLHEFLLTPQSTAWIISVSPVLLPGITKPVMDGVVQEIDIATGLVLFEWHALDHVSVSDSAFTPKTHGYVFDPYHMNSVMPLGSDAVLICMRNTSAVYKVSLASGKIAWQLGGKHSSFRLEKGVSTAFQHDAVLEPDGSLTMFDDGAGPPALHRYSRGIRVSLDTQHMVARLAREYDHSPQISSDFEGNVQQLSDGDVFMGWGQQPFFSEDNGQGQQIFDGRFVVPTATYRAYRFHWSGQPAIPPAAAAGGGPYGTTAVYASWNGATDVASWRVLTGASASSLWPLGHARANGFETTIPVNSQLPYYAVQALSSSGAVLSTSPVAAAAPHLALFSHSVFISGDGFGAIPAECVTPKPCSVRLSVAAGRTVIATTQGGESLGAGRAGLLFFTLSPGGRSMLARAKNHRLPVTINAQDRSGLSSNTAVQLIPFKTQGPGPQRSFSPASNVQFVGSTDFVSDRGVGGILLACYSTSNCQVSGKLTAGSTTIASTGSEPIGPGQLGYLVFTLNSAGRSLLQHASGNQLATTVSVTAGGQTATAQLALVRFS